MTTLTSQEETLLKAPDHRSDLYLSIYKPSVALACQVNGTYDTSDQTVDYDNVTEGSYLNIEEFDFQVALIGTTLGGDELGRTYVRSATATTLRFAMSDHIDWADDLYVTVLEYIEIIPVFPRIIQNPADELDVIFYKFFDVAYTDQNEKLGTFPNIGCHYAGFRDPATGLANVYWSASGSHNLLGANFTNNWSFEGATITGSTSYIPGYISWDTPGHYRVIWEGTSTNGTVDRSIRYVSIYDRPGVGSNTPYKEWEITDFSGTREGGGYRVDVRIHEVVPKSEIMDGALVVIFADEWYGSTKQSIGGNSPNRQTIKFVGYITNGTIRTDYTKNYTEFEVLSPTGIMQLCECFSISVESKKKPDTWYELLNMDTRRAIYHYLVWHSTVLKCCDFQYVGDDASTRYFDSDRESLYDAINTAISSKRNGLIIADKQGKIWAEEEISGLDNVAATYDTAITIDNNDWIGEPIIDERQVGEVSFIEMGGVKFNHPDNSFSAMLASAPGVNISPAYKGKVERIQGLSLNSQAELNTIVGNMLAWKNARYPSIDLQLRQNFSNLDIAPQELIKITMLTTDNNRGVSFSEKAFAVRGVTWNYDASKKLLLPRVDLYEATQGFGGTTISIPDVPPVDTPEGGTVDEPPISVPSIPAPAVVTGADFAYCQVGVYSLDGDGGISNYIINFGDGTFVEAEGLHAADATVPLYCSPDDMWSVSVPTKVYSRSTGIYMATLDFLQEADNLNDDAVELYLEIVAYNSDGLLLYSSGVSKTEFRSLNPGDLVATYYSYSVSGMFYLQSGWYLQALVNMFASDEWTARFKVWQIRKL